MLKPDREASSSWETYYRSFLFWKRMTAIPSMKLPTLLPKNLLRGLRVPSILMWCSGARKK
jgi:hypothetical protein